MYLDRLPQVGDKIEVTAEPYRTAREAAGLPNKGIVIDVVAMYRGRQQVYFSAGTVETSASIEFCKVLNRELQTLQNGLLLPNPQEQYYGA